MAPKLDDMQLFAVVAELGSFTRAARTLNLPKQTVSRRIKALETHLGVQLLQRTTRSVRLTAVGASYATKCAAMVGLARDADALVRGEEEDLAGGIRLTADPVFGEAFLGPLLIAYAKSHPLVKIEATFTRRRVDLVEEGVDLAFRVGHQEDESLTSMVLGPAEIAYVGSPDYLSRRGVPKDPEDLVNHDGIVITSEGPSGWPFRSPSGGLRTVPMAGRLRFTSLSIAHQAALAGLGLGLFPAFVVSRIKPPSPASASVCSPPLS